MIRRTLLLFGAWMLTFCEVSHSEESLILELSVEGDKLKIRSGMAPDSVWEASLSDANTSEGRFRVGELLEVTDDSLVVRRTAYSKDRLGRLEVTRPNGHVKVQIYDRGDLGPAPSRTGNIMRSSSPIQVDSGRFVRGFVLSFGGGVQVAGEVNRSVVCVGCVVSVLDGGVVRGSVVALGGHVNKAEAAFVYGDLYADNQQKFQPRWYEDPRQDPFQFHMAFDYNRVTGGLAWAGATAGPQRGLAPRLALEAGYAFGSELWHYRVGLVRDTWDGPLYHLGFYRDTKDDDANLIGRHENTLFALLFGLDYRDYYFAQGFQTSVGWAFSPRRRLTLAYFHESLSPLSAQEDQWSLWNGGDFPRNYETLWRTGDSAFRSDFTGRLVYFKGEVQFRLPENMDRRQGNWTLDLAFEASSPALGSDFEYTRYGGELTRIQPLWEHQVLRARLTLGASGGDLPSTRHFYLGGIGSLRGFDHKEFFGDQIWFLNAEYGWSFGMLEVFGLYDAGQVAGGGGFDGQAILHDVGLGVQIQNTFRVQVAADARFERAALFTVRFTRTL